MAKRKEERNRAGNSRASFSKSRLRKIVQEMFRDPHWVVKTLVECGIEQAKKEKDKP